MSRTYKKKEKPYNETTIKHAVQECIKGAIITRVAKKYKLSVSLLCKRVWLFRSTGSSETPEDNRGRKTWLLKEYEDKIALLIRVSEKMGLAPSKMECQNLISDYLIQNEIENNFTNDRPGNDWLSNFNSRHNFSFRKGGQMQLARKSVTSDPFIIYDFYSQLSKICIKLGIENRPECFWNLDETSFPTDPSRVPVPVLASIGSKTVRVTAGSMRENVTVLATCCANGKALPPLVVFKGKKLLHSWIGSVALPGTSYAVSDNGWMTSAVFEDFFEFFIENTKDIRPLLLIVDGHVSHVTLKTAELAQKNNIHILKLPAHCTDLLQPLDVSCFSPLKNYYEIDLENFRIATSGKIKLDKAGFVNMICKSWDKGLSEGNVKSGFSATGIYPLDKSKYDIKRLDEHKLITYKDWLERESPVDDEGTPLLNVNNNENAEVTPHSISKINLICKEQNKLIADTFDENVNTTIEVTPSTSGMQVLLTPNNNVSVSPSTYEIEDSTTTDNTVPITPSTSGKQNLNTTNNLHYSGKDDMVTPSMKISKYCRESIDRRKPLIEATEFELIAELKLRAPSNCKYVVTLVQDGDSTISLASVLHSRGSVHSLKQPDRRRLNMNAQLITQEEAIETMRKRNEDKKNKENKSKENKNKPNRNKESKRKENKNKEIKEKPITKKFQDKSKAPTKKRNLSECLSTTSEEMTINNISLYSEDEYSEETFSDIEQQNITKKSPKKVKKTLIKSINNCKDITLSISTNESKAIVTEEIHTIKPKDFINSLFKPKIDDDSIDITAVKGYFAIYYTDPQLTYYWGKIIKTFSEEDDSEINKVEIEFLQKKTISSDFNKWSWAPKLSTSKPDKDIVNVDFVFYGPIKPSYDKGVFYFPEDIVSTFLDKIIANTSK